MGINSAPLSEVTDVSGSTNIAGAGISNAYVLPQFMPNGLNFVR